MWGAIIQAIDHAKERLQESAGAGIKVADSQHGGGAPISNMDSGAGEAASSILSDENAKTSKTVGGSMRAYGANVGKGFANAGAIATGNKATKWEDIDNVAKKAAEDTVKNWGKRDFNKQENASTAEEE